MNNIKYILIFFLAAMLGIQNKSNAQDCDQEEIRFEVIGSYAPLSITKNQLLNANNLLDLNRYYKPEWVRRYKSVQITACINGTNKMIEGKNDIITDTQRELLSQADETTDIIIKVVYTPENTLAINEDKEFNFSFTVRPDKEASFKGGQDALNKYLKENAIGKIALDALDDNDLIAVRFSINKQGKVSDVLVLESSNVDNIDDLLVKSLMNMPAWQAAEYKSGLKVRQDFVLIAGNLESCSINLFKPRTD
jgi:hypothetical protein